MKESEYSKVMMNTGEEEVRSAENPDTLSLEAQETIRFSQDTKHRKKFGKK